MKGESVMISDYGAYLMLQQYMNEKVRSALPDAPVEDAGQLQGTANATADAGRLIRLRHLLSVEFRRLADRLEPSPQYLPSTASGRRSVR
jgi:hypothetical protein